MLLSLRKSSAGRYRVSPEGADILNFLCWPSLQVTPTAQPCSAPLKNERLDQKMTRTMITHTQSHSAFIIALWCQGWGLCLIAQMKQLTWELEKIHMTPKWYNQAYWLQGSIPTEPFKNKPLLIKALITSLPGQSKSNTWVDKKEWNNAIYYNADGHSNCHTKWSKSERKRQIPYDITYMWNLKYDTKEHIYETGTDSQT